MKTTLNIAVRALIEHVYRSGDLNLEFMGTVRAVDGIRAHQRVQASRPENYTPEIPVSHIVETDEFQLHIGGRIDGIYFIPSAEKTESVIIDEIKTTTRKLDYFQSHDHPVHWGQVKLYGFIYAVQNGLERIQAQLTYVNPDSGKTLALQKELDLETLAQFFNDTIHRYLHWAAMLSTWRRSRDRSAIGLLFPFEAFRPGQRDMAVQVYRTIRDADQLIVQAATGIGKTLSTLFPAVKALGEGLCEKVFYLTARTTGKMAAENAIREMRRRGLRLKSLTLTAKDKICPNENSPCTPEECERAKGYYDRINAALKELFSHDDLHRDRIEDIAAKHCVCPFEFSLEMSFWSDCIICDYNYVFDPRVHVRRWFSEEDVSFTLLVDEAHNLVDRSREMFSAQIEKQAFLDLRRKIKDRLPAIYQCLGKINRWFLKIRKKCDQQGSTFSEHTAPDDIVPLLQKFLSLSERWLSRNISAPFRSELVDVYFIASGFLRIAENFDATYAACYEKRGRDIRLKLFCMDPSIQLAQALKRCRSAAFFSGTMTPTPYFKKILGCEPTARELILPSPFPSGNFKPLISDRISTRYKHRTRTTTDVARIMASFIHARKGNYLLFFPSYDYMEMILDAFETDDPKAEIIVQTPGMTEPERDAFLLRFQAENPGTLIGFAVMGGIFGEGIDLKGERLCGVGIVGVGLPGICLERELIREYFSEQYRTGFEYAYLYPGINRVLQAAGRVIRSESDRGAVLLVDDRFSTFRYQSLLPPHWRSTPIRSDNRLESELSRFWGGGPAGRKKSA